MLVKRTLFKKRRLKIIKRQRRRSRGLRAPGVGLFNCPPPPPPPNERENHRKQVPEIPRDPEDCRMDDSVLET